jgi:phosphoribosyl-AMP cyclohydrolase
VDDPQPIDGDRIRPPSQDPLAGAGFLDTWVARLRRQAGPPVVGVLLRGSYARGTAGRYSDVDLDVLVDGTPQVAYPAWLAPAGERLIHVTAAVCDAESWLAHLTEPADWSFGLPVATPARLLWATPRWWPRLDLSVIRQPPGAPRLVDVVTDLGKVAAARAAGDEIGGRYAAADLARACPSVLRMLNPPVTVDSRRAALSAALELPVTPPGYRVDLLTCLGLAPRPAAHVYAAASRLVIGTVELIRPYAPRLAGAVGPDLAAALTDRRLDRHPAQLAADAGPTETGEDRCEDRM